MQNSSTVGTSSSYSSTRVQFDQPIRVVVVDDSADFRVVVCELLKMLFDIEIVGVGANGFEALELTAEHGPDLVIMDVNMPVLDGITAASLIAEHFPTTTIIMMSGDDSPELRDRCLRNGADAFSPKRNIAKNISGLRSVWM
jgi:DNA-binding NarL/FixJ family response regulator